MDRDFGWDLPPGVRTSDIPGNRPEDEAWEAALEKAQEDFDAGEAQEALTEAMADLADDERGSFDQDEFEEKWINDRAEAAMRGDLDPGEPDYDDSDDRFPYDD